MYIEEILKSLLVGITAGICFLYAFQTRIPLPIWALNAFNHPWIILLIIILILIVSEWSDKIGAFLLLLLVAVIIDYTIFARKVNNNNQSQNINENTEIKRIQKKSSEMNNPDKMYLENVIETDDGPPNAKIPYSQDIYPLFKGLEDPTSGPAPF